MDWHRVDPELWGKTMRIFVCGVAAIALSGCSWMGHSHSNYGTQSQYSNYNPSSYSQTKLRKPSRFSVIGSLGTEFVVGGTAIAGNNAAFSPSINTHQVSMKDAYKMGWRAELGGAYQLGNNNEVSVSGFYQQAKGKDGVIGQHNSGSAVEGQLSDYKGYGLEAGLRHNMSQAKIPVFKTIRPYVEARIGAANISDIGLQNLRLTSGAPGPDQVFYKGGWVPTASGLIGFEKPISRHASLGLETGIRYTGGLSADTSAPLLPFLSGTNSGGSRWSVPLQLRGRYRF